MSAQQPANYSTFSYAYHGKVIVAGVLFPIIGIIVVGLRIWARLKRRLRIGVDDWLIMPALLFVIGMGVCLIIGVKKHVMGYPTPSTSTNPADQATMLLPGEETLELLEFLFLSLLIMAYGFIKLSVTFFYRRIFVAKPWSIFDIVTKITIVLIVLWTLVFFLIQVAGCGKNISYNWGPLEDSYHCLGELPELEALMITDFITDLFVILLPFPLIWKLHMTTTRKLIVTGILLLGASSLGASIARMVLQIQLAQGGYTERTDVYLSVTTILYWSMVEAGLAIIASCLPTLQALVVKDSIQSMVASIRSAISLNSLRSRSSGGTKKSRRGRPPYPGVDGVEHESEDVVGLTDVGQMRNVKKPEHAHSSPESMQQGHIV